jgi:uncharacterized protein YqhQ
MNIHTIFGLSPMFADLDTSQHGLIHLGISFVLLAIVAVCVWYIIEWMKLPEKIALIVRIICGLVAILVLLHLFGVY